MTYDNDMDNFEDASEESEFIEENNDSMKENMETFKNKPLNDPPEIKENVHKHELKAVFDVPVQISAVLGKSTMPVSKLLKLGRGAIVELDKKVGESIDIFVNNKLVARGEVVVVEDHLGITMTEIIKSEYDKI